jgi:hypothetical protein
MGGHARKRKRRRNPGIFTGAGDAELLLTMAGIGLGIWLVWGIVQAGEAAAAGASSGLQSLESAIAAPFTAAENWWQNNIATPTQDLPDGGSVTLTPGGLDFTHGSQ